MIRKNKAQSKVCPFLDQVCRGHECMIFNERFERCDIGLLAYNAYLLSESIKSLNPNHDLK